MKFYIPINHADKTLLIHKHLVLTKRQTTGAEFILSYGEDFPLSKGVIVQLCDSNVRACAPRVRTIQLLLNMCLLGFDPATSKAIQKEVCSHLYYQDDTQLTGDERVLISPIAVAHLVEAGAFAVGGVVCSWAITAPSFSASSYLFGTSSDSIIRCAVHTGSEKQVVAIVNASAMQERNMREEGNSYKMYGDSPYLPGSDKSGHRNHPSKGKGATSNFVQWDDYAMFNVSGSYRNSKRGTSFGHFMEEFLGDSSDGDLCYRLALILKSQKEADPTTFASIKAFGVSDVSQAITARNSNALTALVFTAWANDICNRIGVDVADLKGSPGSGENMSPETIAASIVVFSPDNTSTQAKVSSTEGLTAKDGEKLSNVTNISLKCAPRNAYDYASNVVKLFKGPIGAGGSVVTDGKPVSQHGSDGPDAGWGGQKEYYLYFKDAGWSYPSTGPDTKLGWRLPNFATGMDVYLSDATGEDLKWVPRAYPLARGLVLHADSDYDDLSSDLADESTYSDAVKDKIDHIADCPLLALLKDADCSALVCV